MSKKNLLVLFLVICLLSVAGFFISKYLPNTSALNIPSNIKYVEIGGQKIKVDLALTPAAQERGLSGRENLSPNTGMLFVFNKPGYYPFWMPDMNFSIDMIWVTRDMKIDYITKDATPQSYPAIFGPKDNNSIYVLEVPPGFSEQNNLKVGDSMQFTY